MAGAHSQRSSDVDRSPATASHPVLRSTDSSFGVELLPAWYARGLILVTSAVVSFGGVGLILGAVGHYRPIPVYVLGTVLTLLASALSWRAVGWPEHGDTGSQSGDRSGTASRRTSTYAAVAMCVVAVAFAAWNGLNTGHHAVVGRDPGVYVSTAKWLSETGNFEVPTSSQWNGAPVTQELNGLYVEGDDLEFQFDHLFPVLLAEAHDARGDGLMYRVPAILSALGLCAIYAAGTRFLRRPWLTLAAVVTVGVSLPQLNVARETLSESATQLLLWSGIWLILTAYGRKRPVLAFLAGAALGAATMCRIDSIAYLILLAPIASVGWLRTPVAERAQLRRINLAFLAAVVPLAALGTYDVIVLSGDYYSDLVGSVTILQSLLVLGALAGLALVRGWSRWQGPLASLARWADRQGRALSVATAVLVIAASVAAWELRPSLQQTHGAKPVPLVGGLQALYGLPVDSTRTYREYSLQWVSWYLGPILVALSVLGLGFLVLRLWSRATLADWLVLLSPGLVVALYLWNPSIVPDQIWAMRRFVPAVFPLMALLAALAVGSLASVLGGARRVNVRRAITVVGAAAMIVIPVTVTWPVAQFRPQVGDQALVHAACATFGSNGAVLFESIDSSSEFQTAFRTWCNVPVAINIGALTSADTTRLAGTWQASGRTLWVVASTPAEVVTLVPGATPVSLGTAVSRKELQMTIQRPPAKYRIVLTEVYASRVAAS